MCLPRWTCSFMHRLEGISFFSVQNQSLKKPMLEQYYLLHFPLSYSAHILIVQPWGIWRWFGGISGLSPVLLLVKICCLFESLGKGGHLTQNNAVWFVFLCVCERERHLHSSLLSDTSFTLPAETSNAFKAKPRGNKQGRLLRPSLLQIGLWLFTLFPICFNEQLEEIPGHAA